jgi:nucleoside-diphosphate-sugar epimerase
MTGPLIKRVLVTGITGFVGRHVIAPLIKCGYEVHGVSRKKTISGEFFGVVDHAVDLLLPGEAEALIKTVRPTHLLHLAWTPDPGRALMSLENVRWAAATLNLFHSFTVAGGIRAVLVGSCAEYDWGFELLDERETPLRPATLYGTAKNSVRELLEFASRDTITNLAWARLFFLYGPHEQDTRLVATVARSLAAGRIVATTDGAQKRDYMHIEDAAAGLAALLESEISGAINIASGYCGPVRGIVETLGRIAGRKDLLKIGELTSPIGTPPILTANLTRMHEELGFTPHYSLESGLTSTYEWWRARA